MPKTLTQLWHNENTRAGLLYVLAAVLLFSSVIFLGRSLQSPLYYPLGFVEDSAATYEGTPPVNTFNIDLASAAYYEWPTNVLVGEAYKNGELPLWNPYQAGGVPLAAQYSSRAFFPYQILQNISPVWSWDFYMLLRLVFAGLFTFMFLRKLRLSQTSAFLGGLFYMFSGTFIWFINLEQFVNVAMVTPVLLWTLEGLWHWRWQRSLPANAVSIALVLLAGQPETALYVFLMAGCYVIFRVFLARPYRPVRMLGLAACSGVLGLMLASILLVPFLEFMPLSHSLHPAGGSMGVQDPTRFYDLPQMFIPTFYEVETYHRFFPDNGHWDYLGGYTGALLPLLILAGLLLLFRQQDSRWRGPFLFFFLFGLVILLKVFGSPLFLWLGKLPLFDQSWTNRWGGPAWTFPLAAAGALAFEIIRGHIGSNRPSYSRFRHSLTGLLKHPATYGYLVLVALVLVLAFLVEPTQLAQPRDFIAEVAASRYFVPSVIFGGAVAVVTVITGLVIIRRYLRTGTGLTAIVLLAGLELWFAIPRGYTAETAVLKLLPFILGLLIVYGIAYHEPLKRLLGRLLPRWRLPVYVALGIVFLAPALVIDAGGEGGFPRRADASQPAPYVAYLQSQEGHYRVSGNDGVLFPNFAGIARLPDVHFILALSIDWFQKFKDENLHVDELWVPGGARLWFTGGSVREIIAEETWYGRINRSAWEDIVGKLPYYSLLGVKYILSPLSVEDNPSLLVNGRFDRWARGPGPFTESGAITADGWQIDLYGDDSMAVSRNTKDLPLSAADAMQIDYSHVKMPPSYVKQMISDPAALLGKTVTFSVWAKCAKRGAVRIGISGVGTGSEWSRSHPGGGKWVQLYATHTIPETGVDNVAFLVQLSRTDTVLVSKALVLEGEDIYQPFSPSEEDFPVIYRNEIKIQENPDVLPRAFVAGSFVTAGSYAEAQGIISQPGFDLRNNVVLEKAPPAGYLPEPGGKATARITEYGLNNVSVRAELEKPGILVLSDVYYPGWSVTVDGAKEEVYRVDGLLRGVPLTAGEHTVVFSYLPPSFVRGLIISLVAVLVCAAMFFAPLWFGRKEKTAR